VTTLLGVAGSDCESIRDGFIAQPANTISSLAYVVAGLWILWRVAPAEVVRRDVGVAYALAIVVVGIGSVAFHGPGSAAGQFVHDSSIAALLLVVIAADMLSLRRSWLPAAAGAVVAAIVLLLVPDASNAVTGLLIVAAVALEIAVHRHRGVPASPRERIAYGIAIAALAIAGVAQLLGRTDAPLCDPGSNWQAHALWHTLTAVALAAWSVPLLDRT
jgi:Ceramidase